MADEPTQNRRKKQAIGDELVIPIIALAFAIYYISTIWDLTWEAQINGILIGTVLILLICIFFIKKAVQRSHGGISFRFEEFGSLDSLQWRKIGLLLLAVGYVFFIQWLGFTLTTVLFLAATMALLGVRSLKLLLGISVLLSGLGYIFFIVLLDTRFPLGPFERLMERLF
jgi:hypothetical protein